MKELIFPQKGLDKVFFRIYVFLIYLVFIPIVIGGALTALYVLVASQIFGVPNLFYTNDVPEFIGGTVITFIIFVIARSVLYRGFLFITYGNKKDDDK